jgi:hypothetical protein
MGVDRTNSRSHSEHRNATAPVVGPLVLPPAPIRTKGRPRKKRLASAIEGTAQRFSKKARVDDGSGDGPGRRKCSKCGQLGHYATTCGKRR